MKRVWEKLKSRDGASILFAILVFMLCILAGTAALTAAAANSGRYSHLREEQQKYLTVSSAAKLLRDEIAGMTVTETKDEEGNVTYSGDDNKIFDLIKGLKKFGGSHDTLELTVSGPGDSNDEVTAVLEMDSSYTITVTVGSSGSYQALATFPATREGDTLIWSIDNVTITGLEKKEAGT